MAESAIFASVETDVLVIGAGLTGLTLAWRLQAAGKEVLLLEAGTAPGGNLRSVRKGPYLLDCGPNTLLLRPAARRLLEDLQLEPHRPQSADRRFIVRGGKLQALTANPASLLGSGVLSLGGKLRLLTEPFRARGTQPDETVQQFFRRRLGAEAEEWLVNSFIGGIYAGDPAQLHMASAFPQLWALEQQHGSLLKGMMAERKAAKAAGKVPPKAEAVSFPEGMQQLATTLADRLGSRLLYGHQAETLERTPTGWALTAATANGPVQIAARRVVLALPAAETARLLASLAPVLSERLRALVYPPVRMLHVTAPRKAVQHSLDGFGALIPAVEGLTSGLLGMVFSSTLFPERCPADEVLLTLFVGGMRNPAAARSADLTPALVDAARLIGSTVPLTVVNETNWPAAIPQYGATHPLVLTAALDTEEKNNGLYLTGNWRAGISMPDCIQNAYETADRLLDK